MTQKKRKTTMKRMLQLAKGGHARWIAMGTLAAYAAISSTRTALAFSPTAGPNGSPAPAATLPLKRFDIGAGPLDEVIAAYEKATGLTVRNVLPSGTLPGFKSAGVTGLYREDEALRLILNGTGLNFRMEDATTAVIGVQATESVSVSASATSSISLDKFTEPLLEIPQTVTVVPQFLVQDQAISTLRDSLRNVPGISLAAGEAGAQGDNLTIRGFTARNDIFLDGIRDFGSYYRDSFNYEQVEALEGPAGIQFGRGSTGGVVNQESKVPEVERFIDVQAQFGTDATKRLTADLNSRQYAKVGGTAFRANLMAEDAGVAGRDAAELRRFGVAPSISIGMNANTRATLSYVHLNADDTPDYGMPWLYNKLAPADRHSYFGFPDDELHQDQRRHHDAQGGA